MGIEKITEILRMCELFNELSDNELASIAKLGRIEKFEPGKKIYEQGNIGTKLYILSQGRVTLERKVDLGGHRVANLTVFALKEQTNRRLMGGWSALVGEQHVQALASDHCCCIYGGGSAFLDHTCVGTNSVRNY